MHEGGAVEGQSARPCERLAWAVHKSKWAVGAEHRTSPSLPARPAGGFSRRETREINPFLIDSDFE